MTNTYRAMQVSAPGILELVERPILLPGNGEVLISVQACGVCGADASDIERADPADLRVPGHEVVGTILATGPNVPGIWTTGQRVGVGRLAGHCNECDQCRQGRFQLCRNQRSVGSSVDGGYAEMMIARATGLVSIPDELGNEEAAPILCAGLATFNALKRCGAQAGDTVAIVGIGGLGHMAIQYARKMGFRVVAIGRGTAKADDAIALGAHLHFDSENGAADRLREVGGAAAIVSTIGNSETVASLLPGLALHGRLVLLGVGKDPFVVSMGQVVGGERSVLGSLTGTPFDNEKTLDFSVLSGVRPMFETMPFEQAADAYARLKKGDVRYRLVLTMTKNSME